MIIDAPANWKLVDELVLEAYLVDCEDYLREARFNALSYRFRRTDKQFAVVMGEKVFMDPALFAI